MMTLLKIILLWLVLIASVSCQINTSESANLRTLDAAITTSETTTADASIAEGGFKLQGRWCFVGGSIPGHYDSVCAC